MFEISKSVCTWQIFQPSLIFASKAGAYLSTFNVLHPWKGSLHYSQTFDWAGKTKHGETLLLITNVNELRT
jgi:hypothetical protein